MQQNLPIFSSKNNSWMKKRKQKTFSYQTHENIEQTRSTFPKFSPPQTINNCTFSKSSDYVWLQFFCNWKLSFNLSQWQPVVFPVCYSRTMHFPTAVLFVCRSGTGHCCTDEYDMLMDDPCYLSNLGHVTIDWNMLTFVCL